MSKIQDLNAYFLSGMADAAGPDSPESAGALFLIHVRDAVVEAVNAGRIGADSAEDISDVAHEIADSAPDVYTHTRWQEFVDLAAHQEEPELGEWPDDLTDAAGVALYQIAYRLVVALVEELGDEESADEE